LRFGILGDAKIAREKLVPALRKAGCDIVHLGKRDELASVSNDIWKGVKTGSYEDVLADPKVEAVYIPLPNHLHVPWSVRAMEAGKAVLCEKPMALSIEEIGQLERTSAQTGCYIYEAFMVRHHPQWDWLTELNIGAHYHLSAQFSYPPQPEGNIRNIAAWGGGPVWDIGCYCVLAGLRIFGTTPRLLSATFWAEQHLDVEQSATALLEFGDGRTANFSVSSAASLSQLVRVVGTDGWAQLDVPFNPPRETTARWAHVSAGKDSLLGPGQMVTFEPCDHYQLMVEAFVKAVRGGETSDFNDSRALTGILSEIISYRD
tara:strand:+ start:2354 stop:3304 length:951 start_codon:yes stop_codon:yes gene_type:complete